MKEIIPIACDHAGYELKMKVIAHLRERGYEVEDFPAAPGYKDFNEWLVKQGRPSENPVFPTAFRRFDNKNLGFPSGFSQNRFSNLGN